jgi:hypothetical protein
MVNNFPRFEYATKPFNIDGFRKQSNLPKGLHLA